MLREIVLFKTKLDKSSLEAMQRALDQRFKNVAKKFGRGLISTFKGGAVIGAVAGIAARLINPMKEVQDAIDKALNASDTISTNAQQFGTTAGRLFRLQQLAKSTGLDESSLMEMISKFQVKVAEAAADPEKQTSVRGFVGSDDIADAFFRFIQGLQTLSKEQQLMVQSEVFGAKAILQQAEFMQLDFAKQISELQLDVADRYDQAIEKQAALQNFQDVLRVRRENEDVLAKAGVLNKGILQEQDMAERKRMAQENQRIQSYASIIQLETSMNEMKNLVENGLVGFFSQHLPPAINAFYQLQSEMRRFINGMLELKDRIMKVLSSPWWKIGGK